jgi:hypothetical protein
VFSVPLELFLKVMRQGMVHPSQTIVRRALLLAVGGFARELRAIFDLNLMFRLADRVERIVYRSDVAVAIGVADVASFTASIGPSAAHLGIYTYQALMHARLHCARHKVQACVRSRQAWVLREFAQDRLRSGQPWEAVRLSCEAVMVAPTAGAVWAMLSATAQALRRHHRSGAGASGGR